jgi:sigma-B regulation protein RsbU (phosphoserine phosphatase)
LFISLITAGIVGTIAFTLGKNTLRKESFNKLTAIREMKANQIENYFHQIFDQVVSLAESRTVIEAATNFRAGFDKVKNELGYSAREIEQADSLLEAYYQSQFIEHLIYRDTTINYFSLPNKEHEEGRSLWSATVGSTFGAFDTTPEFPLISPREFSGSLQLAGSSTVSSLANYIIDLYKADGAEGEITYQSTGTLEGIQSLVEGNQAELVGTSRKLGPVEHKIFSDAGLKPLEFRIGTDALVVVVSEQNYFLNNISSADLAKVFTRANRWSDVNSDWPDEPIHRFIPSEGSGSYHVFSEVILGGDQQALINTPNTTVIIDGKEMAACLSTDPHTIAFFSYNYFDHGSSQKILDIDGITLGNPAIRNDAYPLTRPLYLVTTEHNLKTNEGVAFLLNYFLNIVGTEIGTDLAKIEYWPGEANQRMMQHMYIASNPYPRDARADLIAPEAITSYNTAHKLYHPIFKNYMDRFGYYDILLLDAESGQVIYSVSKEVDFATDMLHGPYRNSGLASVYRKAIQSDSHQQVFFEDFSTYLPSYNAPASFIASPVFDGEKMLGVLVVQLPIDKINYIMTDDYDWEDVGLGKSGETYLVGADYLIRNQSRFLIEDPDNYFRMIEKADISHQIVQKIRHYNSSIGLQPVITKGTRAALAGETGIKAFYDYRNVEVLSAYKPLDVEQVDWVIMSEIDKSEALSAISEMVRNFLIWFFVLLVLIFMLSIFFSRNLSRPIQVLTRRASQLAAGDLDQAVVINQGDEIGLLGNSFEKMRLSLKTLISELKDINQNLEKKVTNRTAELEASNRQIQAIVDNLADGLIIIDEKGIIQFYSPSAGKLFQYSQEEITGKNISLLTPSPHKENHDQYLANYLRTGEAKVVGKERIVYAQRKDGTTFPARLMISEVVTGTVRQFVGLVGDLTSIKEAEEKLRTQSTAMQAAANGIVITSIDGAIQWVNAAFSELTGYSSEEVIGRNPRILNSGKHDKAFFKGLWDTILSGHSWHDEIINKRKNGELYFEEQTITPVFGEDNQITSFVGIKQDITERIEMEAIVLKAKKRMEKELNVAKEIQMSMLPLIFPAFPKRKELDLFASLIPAREVGGDFYDFYFIDESHFCFVVGDVSGKGVPAALMMAVSKTLLKSRAANDKSTASILTHVNNEIARDNEANMFITIFIAILDTVTGELVYSNAGHNPSYLLSPSENKLTQLTDLHGPVVGALPELTYTESNTRLSKSDSIFVYTDGVTEAFNIHNELFSDSRLEEFLSSRISVKPDGLVKGIIDDVKQFEKGQEQTDDITVLAMTYKEDPGNISTKYTAIEISNKLEEIIKVQEAFGAFAVKNSIPKDTVQRFNIVLDEILNNIISYAYTDLENHSIEVQIELRDEQLVVTIIDDGVPFNPFTKAAPNTSAPASERQVGGLGIHLVKKMVDSYNYKRDVKHNIITLVKYNINV